MPVIRLKDKGMVVRFPDEMPMGDIERVILTDVYETPALHQGEPPGILGRIRSGIGDMFQPPDPGVGPLTEADRQAFALASPYDPPVVQQAPSPNAVQTDGILDYLGRLGKQAGRGITQGVGDQYLGLATMEAQRDIPAEQAFTEQTGISALTTMDRSEIARLTNEQAAASGRKPADLYDEVRRAYLERKRLETVEDLVGAANALPQQLPGTTGKLEEAVKGMSRSLPAMVATPVPLMGPYIMFQGIVGPKYAEYRKKGYDRDRAFQGAVLTAAGQVPVEFAQNVFQIGNLTKVGKAFGAGKGAIGKLAEIGKAIFKGGASGGVEEFIQTYPEAYADAYVEDPERAVEIFISKLPETHLKAFEAGQIGAIGEGLLAGIGSTANVGLQSLAEKGGRQARPQQEDQPGAGPESRQDAPDQQEAADQPQQEGPQMGPAAGPTTDIAKLFKQDLEAQRPKEPTGFAAFQKRIRERLAQAEQQVDRRADNALAALGAVEGLP